MTGSQDTSPASVLLVDDNADNLLALEAVLDRLGLRLVFATSGAQALAHATREDFAVILLDVQMAGMDGFETASRLKEQERSRATPIIFLTANSHEPSFVFRGYRQGAVDYLVKPLDADILRSKVAVFVELFRARDELRRQERRLRESELAAQQREHDLRYRALAESMPQIAWTCDRDGRIDYLNRRWFEYTGLASETPLEGREAIHPDDLRQVERLWEEARASGRTYEVQYRLRRADGIYRWHLGRSLATRDANGRIARWVGTATDIDDQKRAERDMRVLSDASAALGASLDAEDALQRFAEATVAQLGDLCVVELLEENKPRRVALALAPEASSLEPSAALVGCFPSVLRTPQAASHFELSEAGLDALDLSSAQQAELRRLGAQSCLCVPLVSLGRTLGCVTWIRVRPAAVVAEDLRLASELAHRAALALDNARLYRESQSAVRLRDEFLSIASHELKTPLTPLNLKLAAIERSARESGEAALPAAQVAGEVGAARQHIRRIAVLVDQLLDVSRIRAGQLDLVREQVELCALVREVAARFGEQAAQSRCRLELVLPADCYGEWDFVRLDQVITNLVSNAIKYGAPGPVQLWVEVDANRAVLFVRDQGIGMNEALLGRLFGRFERGHSERQYGGLGLGLYIAHQIVHALGGGISVTSAPHQGTTFRVELPRQA